MKISTIIEIGWIPTGLATLFYSMPIQSVISQDIDNIYFIANQVMPIADNQTWTLYLGFIGTGLFLIGAKAIDLVMYWRNKNKDTAQGQLDDCRNSKVDQQNQYEERLKGKEDIILIKNDQIKIRGQEIEYLKNLIKDLTKMPSTTNITIAQPVEKIEKIEPHAAS